MTIKTVHLFLYGRVQGVFFRASMYEFATRNEVRGWVRNTHDGKVEALLQGEPEFVDKVIAWAGKGPMGAKVDHVEIKEGSGEFLDFKILETH